MKASVADAAGMDTSPTGATCDIRAPSIFCAVTRGRCPRVRPDRQLPIRCGHNVRRHSPTAPRSRSITEFSGRGEAISLGVRRQESRPVSESGPSFVSIFSHGEFSLEPPRPRLAEAVFLPMVARHLAWAVATQSPLHLDGLPIGRSPTGVSDRVDHRVSVADRPLHLSRYGRLIGAFGGVFGRF